MGSQGLTAKKALVEDAGAELVGVAVIVDQTTEEVRRQLPGFFAIVRSEELGPSS